MALTLDSLVDLKFASILALKYVSLLANLAVFLATLKRVLIKCLTTFTAKSCFTIE